MYTVHRSIGYHNHDQQSLVESSTRLKHLRVYDNRDRSLQSVPCPSPWYPLTHVHRSIGYHNWNPQSLTESTVRLIHLRAHTHRSIGHHNHKPQSLAESVVRLMQLRVYDIRDNSHQSVPSPSLYYSLTYVHNTLPTSMLLTISYTQVLWFLECLTRPTVSCCVTTRTRLIVCLPTQPIVFKVF